MNKLPRSLFILIFLAALWAGAAWGDEFPFIHKGIRPMGMGGAFTAVSDDANALFYNPAGLARVKSLSVSILPLEVEVGKNTLAIHRETSDVDFSDPEETAEFLQQHVGDRTHLGVSLVPGFSLPGLAFALFGTARADLEEQDMADPRVFAHGVGDAGAGIGYAHPLLDNTLLLGASLKYDHRESLDAVYTVQDITSDGFRDEVKDDIQKGNGMLLDLGAQYSFNDWGFDNVHVGVSADNLIGGGLGDAEDLDPHVDMGVAVDENLWITRTTFALDYVDLFSQADLDSGVDKRIRLGIECRLPLLLTLRAGVYQGYLTGGVSLDGKVIQLDALTYAEDVDTFSGQHEERRYVLRFLLGF